MTLIVLSLGQWIQSDIEVLKNNFSGLVQNQHSPEEIWAWFKPHLPLLRLEKVDSNGDLHQLELVRQAFNTAFAAAIDYPTFLSNFNAMCTITPHNLAKLSQHMRLLQDKPSVKIVLVSHTNHYHLQYILAQLSASVPMPLDSICVVGSAAFNPEANIFFATSMYLGTIEHVDTLRATLRYFPIGQHLVSYLETITYMADHRDLTYHNPGKQLQYLDDSLTVMDAPLLSPSKQKIVLRVGDLLVQDRNKALAAFLEVMQPQYRQERPLRELLVEIMNAQEADGLIKQFKMGMIDEAVFVERMITQTARHTGVTLTVDQFNRAWAAMNPSFAEVASALERLMHDQVVLRERHCELVFVGYSNPKDINHWIRELKAQDQPYSLQNGDLVRFAGVPLFTSFVYSKSPQQLIRLIQSLTHKRMYSPKFDYAKNKYLQPDIQMIYVSSARGETVQVEGIAGMLGVIVRYGWNRTALVDFVMGTQAVETMQAIP